jgi:hypothetical protein
MRDQERLSKRSTRCGGYLESESLSQGPEWSIAYLFFYNQLSEFFLGSAEEKPLADDTPLESRFDATLHALKAALQVVVIDLGDGDDAQVIFETLNARGEPLLPADLLRNYIFLRAARLGEPQEALYAHHWKPFDEPFWRESVRQGRLIRPRSDLFMQHYLSSRQFNDVPISHLFVEYKHWIDSERLFATVAAELEALAKSRDNYRKFISSPADTPLGASGRFLEIFDVGTVHPLMLILTEASPSENEMAEMLNMLESYILRRTVCGLPTKAYNRVFLTLAGALSRDGISPVALRERLSNLTGESSVWPSDESFAAAFLSRAGYVTLPQARVLYILKRINESFHLEGCLKLLSKEPKVPKRAIEAVTILRDFQNDVAKAVSKAYQAMEELLADRYKNQEWEKRRGDFPLVEKLAKKHSAILEFIEEYVLNPVYETVRSPREDQDRVVIITIHSAKGTEREVCYVMNVSPQAYPTSHAVNHFDRTEEERRVLYVALTRAKDELIVTRHAPRGSEGYNLWAHSNHSAEEDVIETYFFNSLPEGLFQEHVHYQSPPSFPCGAPKAKGGLQVGIRID